MATRILLNADTTADKVGVTHFKFANREPFIDHKIEQLDDNKNYLFCCKNRCGPSNFVSLGGGSVECTGCSERYVMTWDE